MSDNQEVEKSCLEKSQLKSDLSPSTGTRVTSRNKFALNQVVGEQLESIRKLGDPSKEDNKASSTSFCTELNNNTIDTHDNEPYLKTNMSNNHLNMMESSKKETGDTTSKQQATESGFKTTQPDLVGLRLAQKDLPISYTSIFAQKPSSGRISGRAVALKKQSEIEIPSGIGAIDRHISLTNKRLQSSYCVPNSDNQHDEVEDDDEDDEVEDDDEQQLDERIPFNSTSKLRNNRKKLTSNHKINSRTSPTVGGKPPVLAFDNKCEMNSQRHMKISMADCRPPSFNTCQSNFNQHQWRHQQHQQSTTCIKCDCSNCYKKFNSMAVVDANLGELTKSIPAHGAMFPKTYSFHMILKSIILVLITLLLLMLFFGILMVSHHLPRAVERMMNTPHSFNVTIAGR